MHTSHTSHSTVCKIPVRRYPHGPDAKFRPPEDIHAPFYPKRGCYSSTNIGTLVAQFQEMKEAGITVAVVSWWGRPDHAGGFAVCVGSVGACGAASSRVQCSRYLFIAQ